MIELKKPLEIKNACPKNVLKWRVLNKNVQ